MQTAFKPDSSYLFLTGKVKVLEQRLFDFSRFSRLLENENIKNFINDLSDSGYHEFVSHGNFEAGVKEFIYNSYEYLRKKMSDPHVLDIFMIKDEITNYINHLKDFKKEEFYGSGAFKPKWWKIKELPSFFVKAEENIQKKLGPKDIKNANENLIEKMCMDMVWSDYVNGIKSPMIRNYWNYMIDIKNLIKNINGISGGYYFAGGNIKEEFWKEIVIGEDMPPKVEAQPYTKIIAEESDRSNWELLLKQWLGGFVKEMRKITFGPEPVAAYLISLQEEAYNLNLIYTGIQMEMPKLVIQEKLSMSYV
jgi:V/A-type H+-transporting ATPase subunit C